MLGSSSNQSNGQQPPQIQPEVSRSGPVRGNDGTITASVIGHDLAIIGDGLQIVSQGRIIVEGKIFGDVLGEEILIGQDAVVSGLVNARAVTIQGSASGTIKADDVALASTARVDGEIHHQSLQIQSGAEFEGRCRRGETSDSLQPNLAEAAAQNGNSQTYT